VHSVTYCMSSDYIGDNGEVVLEMKGITKRFPRVLANDRMDFQLKKGEIHALVGENGAGKTTLMSIAYGLLRPDQGEILVRGRPVRFRCPKDALDLGIGMVPQNSLLIPNFTVVENIILGLHSEREPFLDLSNAKKRVIELSEKYNLKIDPQAKISQLSVGEKQKVDILKMLYRNVDILILDEPTSVLTPVETDQLIIMLKQMASQEKKSIVFVTHKLPEVMRISDRITICRKGKVIEVLNTKDTNEKELARKMVGREIQFNFLPSKSNVGPVLLEVRGLCVMNDSGVEAVKNVNLDIRAGEIFSIAGVSGNGQKELVEALVGLRKIRTGTVSACGKDITNCTPDEIIKVDVGYVPANRLGRGLLSDFSIEENLILKSQKRPPFAFNWFLPFRLRCFLNRKEMEKHAQQCISGFQIATPGKDTLVKFLSGGNLQKVVLARELKRSSQVLICEEPTQGLDVGASEYVRSLLLKEREKGRAILLISSDLDEIFSISDRIAVMFAGEIVGVLDRKNATVEEIGELMTGTKKYFPQKAQESLTNRRISA